MTLRSLALFAHILGMLALFVALAIEWTSLALLRKDDQARPSSFGLNLLRHSPGLTCVAIARILACGTEMAAKFGLIRTAWVGVSIAAMVLMGGLGGAALRPLIRSIGSFCDSAESCRREASKPFLHVSLG